MFQSYTTNADREAGPQRLTKLREEMASEGVTVFLVPHADEHQNEYLPDRAERLAWLTGFTGSAGFAIATMQECVVFVDGRYTLQVSDQIDPDSFKSDSLTDNPPSKWLEANTGLHEIIGYDPWLITQSEFSAYEKAAQKSGASLKPVENLIDRIWDDQPQAPLGAVTIHPVEYAGEETSEKVEEIQKAISDEQADFTVLTDPASLAWLFNIRGNDVVHNPIPLGFAVVSASGEPSLFMDSRKFDDETRAILEQFTNIKEPDLLRETLSKSATGKSVLIDDARVPVALTRQIEEAGGKIIKGRDPVILPRAIKNEVEISGARAAHIRDGVAMCKFLCWLDGQSPENLTEIDTARKLEQIRIDNAEAMGSELKEISFDTISGHGPNGAIVHYRVTEETNRAFTNNSLYLCDSGGQYADGTTDITRTIAIGTPPKAAVTDFTLVLKGHITIATARFPVGTRGIDLDPLARNALWQNGRDFAHGTGHGVGSYLNVHEGPQSISKRGNEVLVPGMIISNEPGYYVEGQYGIRIENLVIVSDAEQVKGGNVKTHSFETITLCPIDRRLIDPSMLSSEERNWLNAYHLRVHETLALHLDSTEKDWLARATAAI